MGDTGHAQPADGKKLIFGESEVLIGQLAKQTGLSRDTIRYYEKLGLVEAPARSSGSSYKVYGSDTTRRLADIAKLKRAGFTLREIRQLLLDEQPCRGLPQRVEAKVQALDRQIEVLTAFRKSLVKVAQGCNEDCSTTRGLPDCVVPTTGGCCS